MKIFIKAAILSIIILIAVILSAFMIINRTTHRIPVTGYELEVTPGMTAHRLARTLRGEKVIRSPKLFILMTKIMYPTTPLKSGWFRIKPDSSTISVIKQIYSGEYIQVSFMIPEGATLKQTNDILVKNGILTQQQIDDFFAEPDYMKQLGLGDFIFDKKYASPEGFLSPDTYTFTKGVPPVTIYKGMISLFYRKINEIYADYADLPIAAFYDKIKMAAIIEREVKNHSEAPIVAGVFYNRLNNNEKNPRYPTLLQSCATIQYILDKPQEQLTDKELKIDSPYNTYIYKGLTPTPICNPGYDALRAAFYPAKHDYYYFVVDDPALGTHKFSKEYGAHIKAKESYKEKKGFK
ncbi:MAG: endolytic transglycosylase MltG [Spirochaetales bacterium]|nr:endolytic transglycosylase MltG [Spirochaetales bacterium]